MKLGMHHLIFDGEPGGGGTNSFLLVFFRGATCARYFFGVVGLARYFFLCIKLQSRFSAKIKIALILNFIQFIHLPNTEIVLWNTINQNIPFPLT